MSMRQILWALLAVAATALVGLAPTEAQQTHPAPAPLPGQPFREGPSLQRSLPNAGQARRSIANPQQGNAGAPFQGTQTQNNQVMSTGAPGQKQKSTTAEAPGALQLLPYKQRLDQLGQMIGVPRATLTVLGLGLAFLTITCVMVGILLAKYVTVPETIARKR